MNSNKKELHNNQERPEHNRPNEIPEKKRV